MKTLLLLFCISVLSLSCKEENKSVEASNEDTLKEIIEKSTKDPDAIKATKDLENRIETKKESKKGIYKAVKKRADR